MKKGHFHPKMPPIFPKTALKTGYNLSFFF